MWGTVIATTAEAQEINQDEQTHEEAYEQALRYLQEKDAPEKAIALLQPIVAVDPLFRVAEEGTATFWLADAYARTGHDRQAFIMRRMGARASIEAGVVDWWLVDAYVRQVFGEQRQEDFLPATELYMRALEAVPEDGPDRLMRYVTQHMAGVAVLLSDVQRSETATERPTAERLDEGWRAPSALGPYVASWLRREDPDLVTVRNERLEEHLMRLSYAWEQYRPEGLLDDRALIFLRLGEPQYATTIPFDTPQMRKRVVNQVQGISTFDFRDNEVWNYRHIDRNATYLFAEISNRYYEAEVLDLLPRRLQRGFSATDRGQVRAQAAVYALYETYQTLSNYAVEYGTRFADVSNYVFDLDMQRLYGGDTQIVPERPSTVASREASRARTEDAWFVQQRERTVPSSQSFVLHDMPSWDVETRVARFLEPDGRTRTEVYWGVDARDMRTEEDRLERLGLTPDDLKERRLLQSVAVHRAADYSTEAQGSTVQQVDLQKTNGHRAGWVEGTDTVIAAIEEDDKPYHLALQWNGHALGDVPDPEALTMGSAGPLTSLSQHRIDSLRTLDGSGTTLEMSDLKPLLFDDPTADPASAPPFPYQTLGPDVPVALYFEIYHLTQPEGEDARYTVDYEILRREDRGLLSRTFTADIPERSVTSFTQETSASQTDELILIEWQDEWRKGAVDLIIRVTDEHTGAQQERRLQFAVDPSG